jgi:hypothetical protein
MTTYRLKDDLTFCLIDGHPVFLDLEEDRYFCLSGITERAFLQWSKQGDEHCDIDALVDQGILTALPQRMAKIAEPKRMPSLSALEAARTPSAFGVLEFLEVATLVLITQFQLKTLGIKQSIERALGDYGTRDHVSPEIAQEHLLELAQRFLQARMYVPLGTRCLLDSLAMARFLRRRHIQANLIIGVTGAPFSAHCWLQRGAIVLTDAVGNIRIYTPIRTF